MGICKRYRRVGVAFIGLWILLIAVELGASLVRGYGFIGAISRLPPPDQEQTGDLRAVVRYCEAWLANRISTGKAVTWPTAQDIAEGVQFVHLASEQPYVEFDIWLFTSVKHSGKFIYTPFAALDPPVRRATEVRINLDPSYRGTVVMCAMARWEDTEGKYHPYKKYPMFVRDHIEAELGGEKWLCFVSLPSVVHVKSELPPIPGTLLFAKEGGADGAVRCCYPQELLPAVKRIYPNLQIPKDAILPLRLVKAGSRSGPNTQQEK